MTDPITPDELEPFAATLLESVGAPPDIAEQVATSLVLADLRGYGSHGVLRIPMYTDMITDDAIDPAATPTVVDETRTTATIDGERAFGQVVGREASRALIDKAQDAGVATVGMRNATHLGRMGEWAERAADAGLLFMSFVNAQGKGLMVASAGSTDSTFSTNPITFGLPSFGTLPFPIVADMATSQVAFGKLREYESGNKPIPGEWAVSRDGSAETDPSMVTDLDREDHSAIRPLGGTVSGYKGTALATVVELFAGFLGVAPVVGQGDPDAWFSNAASFVAIDPLRFSDRETMAAQVEAFTAHFRSATQHPDVPMGAGARGDELLLPGEAEHRLDRRHREDGVELAPRVVDALREMAVERDLEDHIPSALAE